MDLTVPDFLKDAPAIIGGPDCNDTYSGFQPEMDMINRAFAEVMMEGDANLALFQKVTWTRTREMPESVD